MIECAACGEFTGRPVRVRRYGDDPFCPKCYRALERIDGLARLSEEDLAAHRQREAARVAAYRQRKNTQPRRLGGAMRKVAGWSNSDHIAAARSAYGDLPVLWYCQRHAWLSPLNVPCPECEIIARARRRHTRRIYRLAHRRMARRERRVAVREVTQ